MGNKNMIPCVKPKSQNLRNKMVEKKYSKTEGSKKTLASVAD